MTGTPGIGSDVATPPSTLLIVEPEATIARLLALVCGEEGHAAEYVTSPHDALDLLAARGSAAFDVILSAPCAPFVAPYAWLGHLRAWTLAPIVICTRHPAALYAGHRARGFAAVIEEPCDLQDVLDVVNMLTPPGGRAGLTRRWPPRRWPPPDDGWHVTPGATGYLAWDSD